MKDRTANELALDLLSKDLASLSPLERDVIERIASRKVLTRDHGEETQDMGFGARLADRVAAIGGSWGFISAFGIILFSWMLINSPILKQFDVQFDPYPFIFLNLMLSMLAAIQAPIIMMSQNRASEKDRMAAKHDYEVNLRAEMEILLLHEKLEHIMGELDLIKSACGVGKAAK
jgi:uncharacterized membrane protein